VLDRALGDQAVGVTRLAEHGAGALRVREGHAQKQYKLRQVVEVVFDVHDDRLAQLLEQLKRLRDERREYEREVAALRRSYARRRCRRPRRSLSVARRSPRGAAKCRRG
jgi:uncharacterized tellurite resistance protein B-like protein